MNHEKRRFVVCETCMDAEVDADNIHIVEGLIVEARSIIEGKMVSDPLFGTTYEPYSYRAEDEPLIKRMCKASVVARVGPMASVAGAVDAYVIEALADLGCNYAVLNNGGDIALLSDIDVHVGLYSGKSRLEEYAFILHGTEGILGICSSSGRIGHSVSFGDSDICTVISKDPILADAFATRLGNGIFNGANIRENVDLVGNATGVEGCIAMIDDTIAVCGDIPELVWVGSDLR